MKDPNGEDYISLGGPLRELSDEEYRAIVASLEKTNEEEKQSQVASLRSEAQLPHAHAGLDPDFSVVASPEEAKVEPALRVPDPRPRANRSQLRKVVCHNAARIDEAYLAEFCRTYAEAICLRFFRNGKKCHNEWLIADTTGAKGESLHITLDGENAGLWYDFATGEGGDITRLLMAHFQARFPEAVELIERAFGVSLRVASPNETAVPIQEAESPQPEVATSSAARGAPAHAYTTSEPFNWSSCVACFTERDVTALAQWRIYTTDFCRWIRRQELIGFYENHIALPVKNQQGDFVGCHYYVTEISEWRYSRGCRVTPLVVGDLGSASRIDVFESYWDGLDFADKMLPQETECCAVIITRGASNGRLVKGLLPPQDKCEVYIWPQRDVAREDGKVPSKIWLATLKANAGRPVKVAWIPDLHPDRDFDFNDWARELATAGGDYERIRAEITSVYENAKIEPPDSVLDVDQVPGQESAQRNPFPLDALPLVAQKMADEVCKAELVPPSLVACAILGIASASIGAGLCVQSGARRRTKGNLFLIAIAASGVGKWSSYRHISAPWSAFEEKLIEMWKRQDRPRLLTEVEALEAEYKRRKDLFARERDQDQKSGLLEEMTKTKERVELLREQAVAPCLSVGDATKEAMAVAMSHQIGEALACISSEGRGIVDVLCGRYSNGSSDEDFYTAAYTGDPIKVDRISRPPVWLHNPCLTVFWMIQPDKMAAMLAKTILTESGLLQRFLAHDSQAEPQQVPAQDYLIHSDVFANWDSSIHALIEFYRLRREPATIQPTPEAKELFRDFTNEIVRRRRTGGDLKDVQTYAARWAEQAWRISVVLHALEHGAAADTHPLDGTMAAKAIRIARWFTDEQMAVLAVLRSERKRIRFQRLCEILEEKPGRQSTLNDLNRRHGFEEVEVRDLAAENHHKLEIKTVKQAKGRPAVVAVLKGKLLQRGRSILST
jgi:replicative DNA helicase